MHLRTVRWEIVRVFISRKSHYTGYQQEAQLSQTERATLRIIEYFAKSLKITQGHLKLHC